MDFQWLTAKISFFESAGRVFESPRARQESKGFTGDNLEAFICSVSYARGE
jgi:hypothetical protein